MNWLLWFQSLALIAVVGVLVLLLSARGKLRGTTLLWPWGWCLPAAAVWGAVVWWQLLRSPPECVTLPWRYAAGVLSLAPGVSLLGVRRPHHRAWQWVVVSLLGVLLLPLGHWALGASGTPLRLHGAWRVFLGVLLLLQWLHYGFTRHAPAALLLAAAQAVWLGPVLVPQPPAWMPAPNPAGETALACLLVALAVGWTWAARRGPQVPASQGGCYAQLIAMGRLVQDFRSWFGDFWFQRLRWQVMLAAQRAGWPVWIAPTAVVYVEPAEDKVPGWEQAFLTSVEQFLRRFVSPEWIEQRTATARSDSAHDAATTSGSR